jgi:hypothetical protein
MRRANILALPVFAALLVLPDAGRAQTDCNTVPAGPARTDCYITLSRIHGAQSDLAASKARVQSDAARYRQVTGGSRARNRSRQP